MRTSETLGELAASLSAAQGILEIAQKDKTNTFFKKGPNGTKYADINDVWLACRAALSTHNIAIIQSPSSTPERYVRMTTRILHKSGEWIEDDIDFKPREDTPQAFGSCITYARRYSLSAMVGVVAEDAEDDDGNAASIAPKRLEAKKQEDEKAKLLDAEKTALFPDTIYVAMDSQKVQLATICKEQHDIDKTYPEGLEFLKMCSAKAVQDKVIIKDLPQFINSVKALQDSAKSGEVGGANIP